MDLKDLQNIFGKLLLKPEGIMALESEESWKRYLEENNKLELLKIPRARLVLYQNLLLNSAQEAIANIYPYCKIILENNWLELIEKFRREYPCQSFQLYKCAEKFPLFLSEQEKIINKHPYLQDLGLYEWIEVEVNNLPDFDYPENFEPIKPETPEDMVNKVPFWNPAHRFLLLEYNIHEILDELNIIIDIPQDKRQEEINNIICYPGEYRYLVYRDKDDFKVKYFFLNDLVYKLINYPDSKASYYQILENLWNREPSIRTEPLNKVIVNARELLESCFENRILVGSLKIR